jgi:hypothetical protein
VPLERFGRLFSLSAGAKGDDFDRPGDLKMVFYDSITFLELKNIKN